MFLLVPKNAKCKKYYSKDKFCGRVGHWGLILRMWSHVRKNAEWSAEEVHYLLRFLAGKEL